MQVISLLTRTDEQIILGSNHPLIMETQHPYEPILPLVHVRDNLNALVGRAVYYQLVEWGSEQLSTSGKSELILESMGCQFSLGDCTN